jgi:hypothetical protein
MQFRCSWRNTPRDDIRSSLLCWEFLEFFRESDTISPENTRRFWQSREILAS